MKIWVLNISTIHGNNYSAHTTIGRTQDFLFGYVKENWDDGLSEQYGDIEILSMKDSIDAYFDAWAFALDPELFELEELELSYNG